MRSSKGYALPPSWEDSVKQWLAWLKLSGARATTRNLRRGHVRRMARLSATSHPRMLSAQLLRDICEEHEWGNDYRKGMRTSLLSFYDWAVVNGIAVSNPAEGLPPVSGSKPNPRPVPDGMWYDLIAAAPPRERLMARLAGELGMRRAEIAVCSREDMYYDAEEWLLTVHGKGGKIRVLPVPDELADFIIAYCPRGYLFPSEDRWGHLIAPHLSEDRVGRVLSRLLPKGWSGHKLRHRFATRALAGTDDLMAVSEALGHASVATTQRYVKIKREKVRSAVRAAADLTKSPS